MAENKTKPTDANPVAYIEAVPHEGKVADGKILLQMFKDVTGKPAVMWGDRMIGFGTYHYKGRSCEGEWLLTGFAVNKTKLTVYIMNGFKAYPDLIAKLGKHKHSSSCLYINKLADVDLETLRELIAQSVGYMRKKYKCS